MLDVWEVHLYVTTFSLSFINQVAKHNKGFRICGSHVRGPINNHFL